MPVWNNALETIVNVKWAGGAWIVVTTSRSANKHGNGIEGAPFLGLDGIEAWDDYYSDFDINWEGVRYTFPTNHEPPPRVEEMRPNKEDGTQNPNLVLRWGGFDQPDIGDIGPIGATPTRSKPVLVGEPRPPNFESDGYQAGQVIHDLLVFNVNPIKQITGSDEFEFKLETLALEEIPGSGGPVVTYRTIWFPWSDSLPGVSPNAFPVFPGVGVTPGVYPFWDAIHPQYTYQGSQVATVNVALAWMLQNFNAGIPGAIYPPWDLPFVPQGGDSGQAIMQAQVNWANTTYADNNGVSFYLASGVVPDTQPGVEQPEQNFSIKVGYYTKPPVTLPAGGSGTSPFNIFPVNEQNIPQWDLTKADQTVERSFGGIAPQMGRVLTVKLAKNPTTGKNQLTMTSNN